MTAGFGCLAKKDGAMAAIELPRFCTSIVECFSTQDQRVAQNACDSLKSVLTSCIAPQTAAFAAAAQAAPGSTVAHQVIAALASGLNYKYRAWYVQVLQVLTALYTVLGAHSHPLAIDITTGLVQLRATHTIDCRESIETTIGAGIRAMVRCLCFDRILHSRMPLDPTHVCLKRTCVVTNGILLGRPLCSLTVATINYVETLKGPAKFLSIVPLGLRTAEVQTEFPMAWLLPVLKSNVVKSELGLFGAEFVPLASHLLAVSERAKQEGQEAIATLYSTLYTQVWDLLPSFSNNPTDLVAYFPTVAPLLGEAINKNPAIRAVVCNALITLIRTADDTTPIAQNSRNFMLIFLNVFVDENTSPGDKARCLSCIQVCSSSSFFFLSLPFPFARLGCHSHLPPSACVRGFCADADAIGVFVHDRMEVCWL
jgi:hypothetical protein